MKFLLVLIIILFLIGIAYVSISFYVASKVVAPYPNTIDVSADTIAPNHKDITINGVQGTLLKGWLFPSNNQKLIIFVAGITQNRLNKQYGTLSIAHELSQRGYGILMYDARGEGESGGKVITQGILESQDLLQVVQFAEQNGYTPSHIGIIADSLGAVSTLLACEQLQNIGALVIDSAAADMKPVITNVVVNQNNIPSFVMPGVFLVMKVVYEVDIAKARPIDHIGRVPNRIFLFLSGANDKTIPPGANSQLLFQKANPLSKLVLFPGADHVQTYSSNPTLYRTTVYPFLDQQLSP